MIAVVSRIRAWLFGPRRVVVPTPCPYCANPDRNSVFDDLKGCLYDEKAAAVKGIVGGDPPCVCDDYPADWQLSRLGLAS